MKKWGKRIVVLVMCMMLLCGQALAVKVTVSGVCFKYLSDVTDDPSASVKVKSAVSAAQVERAILSGACYGLNYKITCGKPGNYHADIIMTAPDGWTFPYSSSLRITSDTKYVWFECMGVEFFEAYYSQYNSIEPGEYTIELYIDGEWKDTTNFELK